jgi:hypothetical protein
MKVSAEFVVEGVALAALNAKRFAEDALFLYHSNRYHSSAISAVIAIENVGRARRILQLILESKVDPASNQFPVRPEIERQELLKNIRSHHEAEIRTGIVSLQFSANSPVDMSKFNKHAREVGQFPAGTPEHTNAVKQVKRAVKKMFEKITTEFHETRTIQQYVEPDDDCTVWNEPQDAAEQRVRDLIINAINNYNFLISQIISNTRMMEILAQKALVDQMTPLPQPDLRPVQPQTA